MRIPAFLVGVKPAPWYCQSPRLGGLVISSDFLDQSRGCQWLGIRNTSPRDSSTSSQFGLTPFLDSLNEATHTQSQKYRFAKWAARTAVPSFGAVSMGLQFSQSSRGMGGVFLGLR
ncbi:hypothetical protein, partial [Pseudomonas aeruginosa]|uniref:hypothetical protein n=1 Tax=Pseudomonas aeruginosa TaxID=287 RepID=UPI001ED9A5B3